MFLHTNTCTFHRDKKLGSGHKSAPLDGYALILSHQKFQKKTGGKCYVKIMELASSKAQML